MYVFLFREPLHNSGNKLHHLHIFEWCQGIKKNCLNIADLILLYNKFRKLHYNYCHVYVLSIVSSYSPRRAALLQLAR